MSFHSSTQVLTTSGWASFPKLKGDESFITLINGYVGTDTATVSMSYKIEEMYSLYENELDLLITEDQEIFVNDAREKVKNINDGWHDFHSGIKIAEKTEKYSENELTFIGLAAALAKPDGDYVVFELHDEINELYLNNLCSKLNYNIDSGKVKWPFGFPLSRGRLPMHLMLERGIKGLIDGGYFHPPKISNLNVAGAYMTKPNLIRGRIEKVEASNVESYKINIPIYVRRTSIPVWC